MSQDVPAEHRDPHRRLDEVYRSEKPRLLACMRAAGRSLEDAEDLVHDVYEEVMGHLPLVAGIRNLSAWVSSLFTWRLIDSWRYERVRAARGETDVAEDSLREIISAVGLDPLDDLVRSCLADAVNDALRVLPAAQRAVIEAQVFGGMTFRNATTCSRSLAALTWTIACRVRAGLCTRSGLGPYQTREGCAGRRGRRATE